MNKFEAQTLWDAIEAYASSSCELGAEGNSGEFHDDDDEKRLIENLHGRRTTMVHIFFGLTGFRPVLAWSGEPICARHYRERQRAKWELTGIRRCIMEWRSSVILVGEEIVTCSVCGDDLNELLHPQMLLDREDEREKRVLEKEKCQNQIGTRDRLARG